MAEVTLKKRETEVLKINIGDKSYSLPLGGSIPYKQLKKLKTEDGIFEFLSAHLPEEVMDILSTEDINISDLVNRSKGGYAYTMLDLDHVPSETAVAMLKKIDGVLRVRVIH